MGSDRLVDRRVGAAQHNPPLAQFDGLHPSYFNYASPAHPSGYPYRSSYTQALCRYDLAFIEPARMLFHTKYCRAPYLLLTSIHIYDIHTQCVTCK